MQSLIEQAQQAVAEGADATDPRIRALGRAVATADLGCYRTARRGMGLSRREARNRVAEIEGYDVALQARQRKAEQRTDALVRRLSNGDPLAAANVRAVIEAMQATPADRDAEVRRARAMVGRTGRWG